MGVGGLKQQPPIGFKRVALRDGAIQVLPGERPQLTRLEGFNGKQRLRAGQKTVQIGNPMISLPN